MAEYSTVHLYNAAPQREDELTAFFEGRHAPAVRGLRGFRSLQRFERVAPQLMANCVQPWQYMSLYQFAFDDPEIDLPALAPLLADIRDAGLYANDGSERIHAYTMFSPWKYSADYKGGAFDHIYFIPANFVPGREAEYQDYYENVHSVEILKTPGFVAMARGELSPVQVAPYNHHPGQQLVVGGIQSRDIAATTAEFTARALGTSPSGIAFEPRSTSASVSRTVHVMRSIAGPYGA